MKKSLQKIVKQYHPDKWKSIESLSALEGKAQYQNISNAHEEMCMLKNIF